MTQGCSCGIGKSRQVARSFMPTPPKTDGMTNPKTDGKMNFAHIAHKGILATR